jgi:hypothetical protein
MVRLGLVVIGVMLLVACGGSNPTPSDMSQPLFPNGALSTGTSDAPIA